MTAVSGAAAICDSALGRGPAEENGRTDGASSARPRMLDLLPDEGQTITIWRVSHDRNVKLQTPILSLYLPSSYSKYLPAACRDLRGRGRPRFT
jgi:hypothetical protein